MLPAIFGRLRAFRAAPALIRLISAEVKENPDAHFDTLLHLSKEGDSEAQFFLAQVFFNEENRVLQTNPEMDEILKDPLGIVSSFVSRRKELKKKPPKPDEAPAEPLPNPAANREPVKSWTSPKELEIDMERRIDYCPPEKQCFDNRAGLFWLKTAAAKGNSSAMVHLGNWCMEQRAQQFVSDAEAARGWYTEAMRASPPHIDAYFNLAKVLSEEFGEIQRAFELYEEGMALGDAFAALMVADAHLLGRLDQPVDVKAGMECLEKAVEQRHPAALNYLAMLLRGGSAEFGLEMDKDRCWELLSASGDGDALYVMAEMVSHGERDVEDDQDRYTEALKLYELAGEKGCSDAWVCAGAMHFHGQGTVQSYEKAFECYQNAADLHHLAGWLNLASMYYNGLGVEKSDEMAAALVHFVAQMQEKQE